jgi:hypothetical protein
MLEDRPRLRRAGKVLGYVVLTYLGICLGEAGFQLLLWLFGGLE